MLKIEPPGGGPVRKCGPFARDRQSPDTSLYHWHFDAGKRGAVLDLETPGGLESLRSLIAGADVLIESLPSGRALDLGLDAARVKTINPRIVHASVSPFGRAGPRSSWLGTDLTGSAASGVTSIQGFPGLRPQTTAEEHTFHQTGLMAAVSALAALWQRASTGWGAYIDVSMQEAMILTAEAALGFADVEGRLRPRLGLGSSGGAPTIFRCLDGWSGGILGSRWDARIDWLHQGGLLSKEEAERLLKAPRHWSESAGEIDRLTLELVGGLPKETVFQEGQRRRMAVAPVRNVSELFEDPQLAARGFFRPLPAPASALTPLDAGAPFLMELTPWRLSKGAPSLAEAEGGDPGWSHPDAQPFAPGSSTVGEGTVVREGPLRNIRVLDFTVQGAGPVATRLLSSLGAHVVKIESAEHPDGARLLVHPRPDGNDSPNMNGIFNNFNTDKHGITVSLDTGSGRQVVRELAAISDIVIDNFGRDPFPRWALTPEKWREICPDIIVARSSAFGRSGPQQDFIGFGFGIAAAAGVNALTGFPGDAPVGAGALPDFTCNPNHLVAAILAALAYRSRTGQGQIVDLSQQESTICFLGTALLRYQVNGEDSVPSKNRAPDLAPHGVYRCAGEDRWIALAIEDDAGWQRFCKATGRPGLGADPRFLTLADRKANEDALDEVVSAWTTLGDAFDLAEIMQAYGIAAAPVQTNLDIVFEDEHLKARRYHWTVEHLEAGVRLADGYPFRLEGCEPAVHQPAPRLGEHNDLILSDLLGKSEEEISALIVSGAV